MSAIPARRPTATRREIWALILLPLGGVALPVIGWLVGVALLWLSRRWTIRDKLIGTLVLPGGLTAGLALFGLDEFPSRSSPVCPPPTRNSGCDTLHVASEHAVLGGALSIIIPVVLLGAPLATVGYLYWRLRTRAVD